jgi:hypothetical protein
LQGPNVILLRVEYRFQVENRNIKTKMFRITLHSFPGTISQTKLLFNVPNKFYLTISLPKQQDKKSSRLIFLTTINREKAHYFANQSLFNLNLAKTRFKVALHQHPLFSVRVKLDCNCFNETVKQFCKPAKPF